jgi:hypothetical protein
MTNNKEFEKCMIAAAIVALTMTVLLMVPVGAAFAACTGNPHDRDSGPTGNPHDDGEHGNPHDSGHGGGQGDERDLCNGAQ